MQVRGYRTTAVVAAALMLLAFVAWPNLIFVCAGFLLVIVLCVWLEKHKK